ncbi:uncharacterized protein [Patagioenas fasciata]|uniref:uncharacterized protein n=1 Tax=Patagioenas fasciata TaxID=372321 RepID=UPI003A995CA9
MAGPRKRRCIRGACSARGRNGMKRRRRRRKRAFFHTKFPDACTGCAEDGSLHTGCRMNFHRGKHQKGMKPSWVHSKPEAVDFRGVFHLEAPQLFLTPGNTILPATESDSDIYMEQETDFQTPVKIIDAQKMKDSVKSPDHIERLAHKYMQKCVVESSTESESESSTEFSDPYDGDSEDTSIHSDCSLTSLNSIRVAPRVNSAPKAMALEDADTSEDGESLPKPRGWLCPETKVSGIHTVNDCKAALELPSQERDFPRSLLQSSELTRATEAFTSMWVTPDRSLLLSVNPSASAGLLASLGDSAPQPTPAADCDGTSAKQPLTKRKRGMSIPEGASEKLRRKKSRAT